MSIRILSYSALIIGMSYVAVIAPWLRYRTKKLGHSCQVFRMLQKQEIGDKCGLSLLGRPVCQRSWRLLLGVGKARFRRLRAAIVAGSQTCPFDLRFTPRKNKILPSDSAARAHIHGWLLTAYHQMAEPLPEGVTDLSLGNAADTAKPALKRRGRRPRSYVKHQPERSGHHRDVKFLPAGTILSYYHLCAAELSQTCKFSRKIFSRETCLNAVISWWLYTGIPSRYGR